MAKRRFKVLAVVLLVLSGRSSIDPIAIPRVTQTTGKGPSTMMQASLEAGKWAQYLEPFATVVGTSLRDIAQGLRDAASDKRKGISKLKPLSLADLDKAEAHAQQLAKTLLKRIKQTKKGPNIFLPNVTLPLIPVNGTAFQRLVSNVLSDEKLTGVTSIHAEPGVGKSVAVALAMLEWAKDNPRSITVLISEDLMPLLNFFRVEDLSLVKPVAKHLWQILYDSGVPLKVILDNVFDDGLGQERRLVFSLARAAHMRGGQVIIVTQDEASAKEVADLNGSRTRLAPHQSVDVMKYRWDQMQASQLLLCRKAAEKVKASGGKPWWQSWWRILHILRHTTKVDQIEKALHEAVAEFREDDISKILESSSFADGGWTPLGVGEFLVSGRRPVLKGTGAPPSVWVRQLRQDVNGELVVNEDENAFQVKKDQDMLNIDNLKDAIAKKKPKSIQCDPDEINIYLWSWEDNEWIKEDVESPIQRGATKFDCYGYTLPGLSFVFCQSATRSQSIFDIFQWFQRFR